MARTGLSQKPHVCRQRWPTALLNPTAPQTQQSVSLWSARRAQPTTELWAVTSLGTG